MPRGISKGAAIAWDLERRGLSPADAVAIGDSVSDLEMAPAVGRLWITANGAAVDGMTGLLDAVPNVTVTDAAMGEGWAQAQPLRACHPAGGQFMSELEHPFKAGIERCARRSSRRRITEHVKWNAPSFRYAGVDR